MLRIISFSAVLASLHNFETFCLFTCRPHLPACSLLFFAACPGLPRVLPGFCLQPQQARCREDPGEYRATCRCYAGAMRRTAGNMQAFSEEVRGTCREYAGGGTVFYAYQEMTDEKSITWYIAATKFVYSPSNITRHQFIRGKNNYGKPVFKLLILLSFATHREVIHFLTISCLYISQFLLTYDFLRYGRILSSNPLCFSNY